ncbi:MAG: TadE/TadG family type IV pilus assembly protein [Geminicoccaceae bacterium]
MPRPSHRPLPCRRFTRATEGAVAIEFVLMAPILMVMLVGLIDFGAAVSRQMQMSSAVHAGAQLAVARPPGSGDLEGIREATRLAASDDRSGTQSVDVSLFCEALDGTVVDCDATPTVGRATYVRVRLTEFWRFTFPYPGFGDGITLSADQTVRVG